MKNSGSGGECCGGLWRWQRNSENSGCSGENGENCCVMARIWSDEDLMEEWLWTV